MNVCGTERRRVRGAVRPAVMVREMLARADSPTEHAPAVFSAVLRASWQTCLPVPGHIRSTI